MKRAMVQYIALYKLYFTTFCQEHPDQKQKISQLIFEFTKNIENRYPLIINPKHLSLLDDFNESEIFMKMQKFDESLSNQAYVLRNVTFEILLLFTRATQQGKWELHLKSTELMLPYFFAHDQLNYTRLSPAYLAEMYTLQETDPEIWDY